MKNSDDAIERVLTGVREAEAPAGMERRILLAMDGSGSEQHGRLGAAGARGWTMAAVALVALVVGWSGLRHHRTGNDVVETRRNVPVSTPSPEVHAAVEKDIAVRHGHTGARLKGETSLRRVRVGSEGESVAVSEMRAASCPAPPMPLTEQEKLLLRIAHKRAPEEFAALDPVRRAARDADEKAEVQRFFVPTATGDSE